MLLGKVQIRFMKKAFIIAKWEFIEKVKTKTFLISLIVTPAIIIAFGLGPTLLSSQPDTTTKAIGIVDTSGLYFNEIKANLEQIKLPNGQPNFILINLASKGKNLDEIKQNADEFALNGKLEGYFVILNGGTDSLKADYRSENSGNFKDLSSLEEAFNKARIELRLSSEGINHSLMNFISRNIDIKSIKIQKGGGESKSDFLFVFFSSFIFIILLMMMIISSGGMLIRSLLEEKSNRLIEIIVSSCTPEQLLTGKVLGLSSLGITQVLIWTLIGIALVGSSIVPADTFNNIIPILIYFILGFIFYTSIFVGVGSIVTTEQEAQQITSYLSLTLIMPIVIAIPAMENPDSLLVHIFSFIPFTIPAVMILRLNIGPVSLIEIVLTSLIMLLSTYISIYIAARIFRIGILSYGKRPSLKELISWIRNE